MYMINKSGDVGAFLGYKTFTIVIPEIKDDPHSSHPFVRISSWIYPLIRSFSPIYCWGSDKIIFPEPFSSINSPAYIIVRLPRNCSDFQKATLWNILDILAHVKDKFCAKVKNESLIPNKKFFLTEIQPFDNYDLNTEPFKENHLDTKILKPLKFPELSYKGKRFTSLPARLAVSLQETEKVGISKEINETVNSRNCCYQPDFCPTRRHDIVPCSHIKPEHTSSFPGDMDERVTMGGISHDWISLPNYSGNIMRQYILGPSDKQHIKISTTPKTIKIPYILHFAVKETFCELVRQRKEKEQLGIPPSFDAKREHLFGGFGGANVLSAYGPDLPTKVIQEKTGLFHPVEKFRYIQHLESAADYFDNMLEKKTFVLISLEPDEEKVDRLDQCDLSGALIPRPIYIRYAECEKRFGTLMTLSITVEEPKIVDTIMNEVKCINECIKING
ncbi:unnamed protein product [Rodentolepis nana]|uniref:Anoctamin n=1 Tax=Rodentolepis nana TaxID=102285 RepID=A0A0R3T7L3_RODNA|nr:unnamed protein product [Rodentolepis nana]